MTTVAYRDGVMAADSKAVYGSAMCDSVKKIRRVGRWLVGISGTAVVCEEFCSWLANQSALVRVPKFERIQDSNDGVWALIVDTKTGKVFRLDQFGTPYRVDGEYFACGSGMDFALAAMEMGADAARAVHVAIKFDPNSGGSVRALKASTRRKNPQP